MDHGRVIHRHELSDAEWEFVRPLLPVSLRGRKRQGDRKVLNGIVWKFRTGRAWRDAPEWYGPWATLHTRFRRWALEGTFERMLRAAQAHADTAGDIDWLVSVDSTVVRAHQHAAGAIRTWLRRHGIGHTIPERAGQVRNRLRCGSRGGRPPAFDKQLCKLSLFRFDGHRRCGGQAARSRGSGCARAQGSARRCRRYGWPAARRRSCLVVLAT
ncbi:IS5 family transposase [Streptomyces caeni]|uniref:IS5 family transposase n=1 Tax=Streptomyces caeni TaxID=2307231 RepID=A0ABW4ILR2_9ACTN